MLNIDTTPWIIDLYKGKGYIEIAKGQYYRLRKRRTLRNAHGEVSLITGPITIGGSSRNSSKTIDDWFKKLQKDIEKLIKLCGRIHEVVFTGGGTIPIPDWFKDWCARQGIKITVIEPDSMAVSG